MKRNLIVGDLHGCIAELEDLLRLMNFDILSDQIISVGDVMGKGPDSLGVLKLLKTLNAIVIRGNHDQATLNYAKINPDQLKPNQLEYLNSLGPKKSDWLFEMEQWPYFYESSDFVVVHGGLQPGVQNIADMNPHILMNIRTWDGIGKDLKSPQNPPWYECIHYPKTVVFGHWAKRGLIDLPLIKGIDTGCVYGRKLTAYSVEENLLYSVDSHKAYVKVDPI